MKALLAVLLLASSMQAGFFKAEESQESMKAKEENQRLCQLFTEKAETYKKTMREDDLARKTLESYEKRASIYCVKS
jgi:hypothetical protein